VRAVGIIAARLAATRFPSKPLALIHGMPMVGHVYHRSRLCASLDEVWIATCDREIMEYAASIGAPTVQTASTHQRASDRIAEGLVRIEAQSGCRVDVAVLIQGDEPMLVPAMLDELVRPMRERGVAVANLISQIQGAVEFEDPNCVKVVFDQNGFALYFSREPIPSRKKADGAFPMWKQLGLIAFTRDSLLEYTRLAPTPLEAIESVDMNRLLEHGRRILTVPTSYQTVAVDTPSDLARVAELMAIDPLRSRYAR
jgi:3-deoxy-manno-octulosonate cytidylyltransferase (CMP-KDO synthetase)